MSRDLARGGAGSIVMRLSDAAGTEIEVGRYSYAPQSARYARMACEVSGYEDFYFDDSDPDHYFEEWWMNVDASAQVATAAWAAGAPAAGSSWSESYYGNAWGYSGRYDGIIYSASGSSDDADYRFEYHSGDSRMDFPLPEDARPDGLASAAGEGCSYSGSTLSCELPDDRWGSGEGSLEAWGGAGGYP